MDIFSIAIVLFLMIDPLGNINPFLTVLSKKSASVARKIIARELLIALGIMVFFYMMGDVILDALDVSAVTVDLVIGLILFLFALKIIYPTADHIRQRLQPEDHPLVVPMALPLIASPSVLATLMLYSHLYDKALSGVIALCIAWAIASVILMASHAIQRLLGNNGLIACERLMGMILIMLAIQRFMEGIHLFVTT